MRRRVEAADTRAGGVARGARTVLGLLWTAAPLASLATAALAAVAGIVPTVSTLLNRAVLNGLVPRGGAAGRVGTASLPRGVDSGHIVVLAVMLGGLGLLIAGVPHARRYTEAHLRRETGLLIQDEIYRAINAFPGLARFESPAFLDKIRFAQQIGSSVVSTLITAATACGQSLVTGVSMLVILASISPLMTGIVAVTLVPAVAAQLANSRRKVQLEWRKSPAIRRQVFYGRLMGDAGAAKEVRLFGLGDFLRGRMLDEMRSINRGQRVLDRRILTVEGLLALLSAIVNAGGLIWVVRRAAAGRLSIGDVVLFTMAVVGVQNAAATLISRLAELYQGLAQFRHYTDVVSAEPDLPLTDPPRPLPALREGIDVRDVWFRYDEGHPWVLRGVSLFIPAHGSVTLIGLNGAGKSTLVKLICRLYDPQRGAITWDGVDIRDVAPDELRRRIGTLFQDYTAYDLTAAENIGMGDLGRLDDRARIGEAARQAGMHDKIAALPQGYDTMLSRVFFGAEDRADPATGAFLSGGEWQRLALARTLMRADRDLLILDEPSSGLDAEAEQAVHRRLHTVRAGRASLLISHRLGSVRDADLIIVLSGGRVAESGTHADLMAAGGEYRRLFTLQASGYRDEAAPGRAEHRRRAARARE